eukprot:6040300-Pleurochrysis_carterae.AAC.3
MMWSCRWSEHALGRGGTLFRGCNIGDAPDPVPHILSQAFQKALACEHMAWSFSEQRFMRASTSAVDRLKFSIEKA